MKAFTFRLFSGLLIAALACIALSSCGGDRTRVVNGHKFVDLGLPSGTLWAETNLGAKAPEDAGDYFSWGETKSKPEFGRKSAKWYKVEYKGNLSEDDDAAVAQWGDGARMPTKKEFDELGSSQYCTWTWTTVNGVEGYKVTSKSNGNEIFLPAAGCRFGKQTGYYGDFGYYWTSTPCTVTNNAQCAHFFSGHHNVGGHNRSIGRCVRAVMK